MSIILVDMDGVLADWGHGYGATLDTYGEDAANIPRHKDQKSFNLMENLSHLEKVIVRESMKTMRYLDLPVIPGGIKALRSMVTHGHEVMICTSPWTDNPFCAQDKLDWVRAKLGSAWVDRVLITKDKTVVIGDYLIDDKPLIKGRLQPVWQQVMFTQPYNTNVERTLRLNSWAEWKNEDY